MNNGSGYLALLTFTLFTSADNWQTCQMEALMLISFMKDALVSDNQTFRKIMF